MTIPLEDLTGYDAVKRRGLGIKGNTPFMGTVEHSLSEYASLAAAKAAIGTSTKTTLTISEPYTLTSGTVDFSDSLITLKFVNDGLLTVNSGAVVIVKGIEAAGNRQIFAGSGTIRYFNGSVNMVNTAWRAGSANLADVTTAIDEALASFALYGGVCGIYIPQLTAETLGGHELTNSCHIFGNGNYSSGSNGWGNTLRMKAGSTEDYMFKIGEGKYSMRFSMIVLDANGVTGKTAVLAEGSEGAGLTSADVVFDRVTIDSFEYGFDHNSISGAYQLAQTIFNNCIFQGNNTQVRTNSVNAGLTFINTNFALPLNGVGYQCDGGGLVNFFGGEIAGNPVTASFVDANVNTSTNRITFSSPHGFTNNSAAFVTTSGVRPVATPAIERTMYIKVINSTTIELSKTPGGTSIDITSAAGGGTHIVWQVTAKFLVVEASHGAINFVGVQDEGLLTLVENNADDINGIINFSHGCLMQSKVLLDESCQVNINECNIMGHAVQGDTDLAYVNISNCNFRAFSVDDNQTVTTSPTDVGIGVIVHTENIPSKNAFIQRLPQRLLSPKALDGNPTVPQLMVGHYTEISESKDLIWIGRTDASGNKLYGYTFRRTYGTGRLAIVGDQAGFIGLDFNGDIKSQSPEYLVVALSDESTDLTTGTAKATIRMKGAFRLIAVRAEVNTAPTGSTIIVDVNVSGSTILTTKISIDASEKTSVTAAAPPVIDGSGSETEITIADDAEVTFDIDQIGATVPGKGLKVTLIGYRYGV